MGGDTDFCLKSATVDFRPERISGWKTERADTSHMTQPNTTQNTTLLKGEKYR